MFKDIVTSREELRAMFGTPHELGSVTFTAVPIFSLTFSIPASSWLTGR